MVEYKNKLWNILQGQQFLSNSKLWSKYDFWTFYLQKGIGQDNSANLGLNASYSQIYILTIKRRKGKHLAYWTCVIYAPCPCLGVCASFAWLSLILSLSLFSLLSSLLSLSLSLSLSLFLSLSSVIQHGTIAVLLNCTLFLSLHMYITLQ